jgi:hypothetical protein
LIKRENNYNHNARNCIENFEFSDKEEEKNEIDSLRIWKVFSNIYYLLSMASILSLLIPIFYMILRYELFLNLIPYLTSDSLNKEVIRLRKLQKEIKIKREKLQKKKLKNEKQTIAKLTLNQSIEKDEDELLKLEETNKELELKILLAKQKIEISIM